MDDEVYSLLLNEMPIAKFIAYYLASLFGAIVWFLIKTMRAIGSDPNTPKTFNPKFLGKGLFKLLLSAIVLPWVVIYFPDYGPFIMDGLFAFPQLGEGEDLLMEMNAGSAAILGFFIDIALRKLTEKTVNKYIKKR